MAIVHEHPNKHYCKETHDSMISMVQWWKVGMEARHTIRTHPIMYQFNLLVRLLM